MIPVALTIAGSDPSGGAGLQADLKTFHAHGVYGASVVTLLTVQNTRTVSEIEFVGPAFVTAQIDAVISDIPPRAAKTGALGNAGVIAAVAACAARFAFPLVVDPVIVSKHGMPLMAEDAVDAFVRLLLPHAALVTPNLAEASRLAGFEVRDAASMERAARRIAAMGPRHVLVKGGHLEHGATDLLLSDGRVRVFDGPRIASTSTHGTGCTLAAAITARLARGEAVPAAAEGARAFVRRAIATAPGLGGGVGPVNHFAPVDGGDA
ncbi:MAG: bifunctional hydroxymethylpyrimidine kinase/phosphomethylpyrimidine kinase [Planctomycetota bacterium]